MPTLYNAFSGVREGTDAISFTSCSVMSSGSVFRILKIKIPMRDQTGAHQLLSTPETQVPSETTRLLAQLQGDADTAFRVLKLL